MAAESHNFLLHVHVHVSFKNMYIHAYTHVHAGLNLGEGGRGVGAFAPPPPRIDKLLFIKQLISSPTLINKKPDFAPPYLYFLDTALTCTYMTLYMYMYMYIH